MKPVTIMILSCVVGAVTGCGTIEYVRDLGSPKPGGSVEFVAGNATSVLIAHDASRPGELQYATAMATEKCGIFDRSTAVLDSLNTRSDGWMRATYLCK